MSRIQIGGALPFDNAGAKMFQGLEGSPEDALKNLGVSYANSYNNAMAMNQANYNNIMSGYESTRSAQTDAQDALSRGYTSLANQVIGTLQGANLHREREIQDLYASQVGQQSQALIDRGLGNTTVQNAVQRGLLLDQEKAQNQAKAQFAQMIAGYQSGIGQAGLGATERGIGRDTDLALSQLGFMNSVESPYPDAGAYGALAQQYGAASQANRDRDALQHQANLALLSAQNAAARPQPRAGGALTPPAAPGGPSVGGGSGRRVEPAQSPASVSAGPMSSVGTWGGSGFSGLGTSRYAGFTAGAPAPTYTPPQQAFGAVGGGAAAAAAATLPQNTFAPTPEGYGGLIGGAAAGYGAPGQGGSSFFGSDGSFWGSGGGESSFFGSDGSFW